MAPEVRTSTSYGLPADIYSLGIVLYEVLEGRLPDYDHTQRCIVLPPTFPSRSLVLALFEVDPARRPTATKVLEHVETVLVFALTGSAPMRPLISPPIPEPHVLPGNQPIDIEGRTAQLDESVAHSRFLVALQKFSFAPPQPFGDSPKKINLVSSPNLPPLAPLQMVDDDNADDSLVLYESNPKPSDDLASDVEDEPTRRCRVVADFHSQKEFKASIGDEFVVLQIRDKFAEVFHSEDGREGWLPLSNIKFLD